MKLVLEVKVKAKDGIPTMFLTAQKDGKSYDVLYSSEMTLSDLFKRFDAMTTESKEQVDTMPFSVQGLMDKTIRTGDLVRFIGEIDKEAEEESGLKNGGIYQVVSLSGEKVDIIDRKTRYRMTLLKKDLEFHQKALKETKSIVLETIKSCICGESVVCQKLGDEYFGKCETCGVETTVAEKVA